MGKVFASLTLELTLEYDKRHNSKSIAMIAIVRSVESSRRIIFYKDKGLPGVLQFTFNLTFVRAIRHCSYLRLIEKSCRLYGPLNIVECLCAHLRKVNSLK